MLCPLVRWQLDGALDGAPLGRVAAAHLARCDGCQARAARLDALHGRLAAGARAAVPPPRTAMPVVRAGGRRAAFALATVGAVAAIAVLARPGAQPTRATAPVAAADGVAPDRAAGPGLRAPDGLVGSPDPSIDGLTARLGGVLFRAPRPLRTELRALAADGKRGALAILDIGGVGHIR